MGEILREGIYWAFMGRPFEVLPFLRGKLLSEAAKLNGASEDARLEIERLLKELEGLYKEISMSEKVSEEQIKEILAYREKLVKVVYG
ncbi:MAG: hypothetical protein H0Z18_07485 [Thermococcus sp.]|uniref:hypothetical protein n=1 Tax=Thermococcus sp. TaxID=35749 RepID=UPI001DC6D151|nr:hypothetical protein [Thermococcus sp.]MBO8175082.1 hypothetical protein [Thermococcus sp.]